MRVQITEFSTHKLVKFYQIYFIQLNNKMLFEQNIILYNYVTKYDCYNQVSWAEILIRFMKIYCFCQNQNKQLFMLTGLSK